ncbi:hypothetical protein Dimus_007280 [Dionaea muscipula]
MREGENIQGRGIVKDWQAINSLGFSSSYHSPRLFAVHQPPSSWYSLFLTPMYLQYYINENGDKVYTTKKESPLGVATESAHPGP